MASMIAWIDHDELQRQQLREFVAAFREQGAVDELGMGRIRDAFSDRLFPGTSVLWRRARYLLFVPWVYLLLEAGGGGRGDPEVRARRLWKALAAQLNERAGASQGVIGASGADVKQTPDVILWAALDAWDLRRDPGRLAQVRAEAVARSRRRRELEDDETDDRATWHPRVALLMPDGFPEGAHFDLTTAEAELLGDLTLAEDAGLAGSDASRRKDSLLALMVRDGSFEDVDVPWQMPHANASPELASIVDHAGCFSDLIQGTRLLYAWLAAASRGETTLQADIERAVAESWALTTSVGRLARLEAWFADLDAFEVSIRMINPNISAEELRFVRCWGRIALEDPAGILASSSARELVINREHQVKGAKRARLRLDGTIGRDASAAEPQQLVFRWFQASSIARDIRRTAQR